MATLVLSAVGTALGGPLGGAVGALIGRQVDQVAFGGGSREGPRLKELSVTTSSYGSPIPRQFGRMRIPGTVIWSTELQETSSKQGGGKGKPSTTTYSYSVSFAVALSSSPISSVERIWADGNLLRGINGDLKAEGAIRIYTGEGDAAVDPLIAADQGENTPAFRDLAYVVFEDLQLADFGNRIPALNFEVLAKRNSSVSLTELVPQATNLIDDVILDHTRGFADEGGPLLSSLRTIEQVFPLVCTTTEGGLALSAAETLPPSVEVLPEQLALAEKGAPEERSSHRNGSPTNEPAALRYYDEQRDYQPSVQRALGRNAIGRERVIELPASLDASGARALVNAKAQRSRWQGETAIRTVAALDPNIRAGSIVRIPESPGLWRIKSWEWFDQGLELTLDRLAPNVLGAIPSDHGPSNRPVDVSAAPTLLDAFELPSDGSTNANTAIVYAAASSSSDAWNGAALYAERSTGLIPAGNTGRDRATIGTLVSSLGSSSGVHLEATASLDVELISEDFVFSSTDVTALALGSNRVIVGGEVIQFLNAEPFGQGRWKLSGLLRGRAGTESEAIRGHAEGTRLALLDDTLTALDPSDVASDPTTRIAAIGFGDSEPAFADLRNVGLSLRPPVPVHPRSHINATGDLTMCWTRRARGQWRWGDGVDVPLVEEREQYLVGYGAVTQPFRTWIVDQPKLELSRDQQVGLVAGHGTDAIWVCQIGTYSKSDPLLLKSLS